MNVQDTIRKMKLLASINEARGFTAAEVECARRISRQIAARAAIRETYVAVEPPVSRMGSWSYWEQIAGEFDLPLRRFRNRASLELEAGRHLITINVAESSWSAQRRARGGWSTTSRDRGPVSLRRYLSANLSRGYSMLATPRNPTDTR